MNERSFDELLADLERSIARLADGTAPLEDLVAAHQQALDLLRKAEARLRELRLRADEGAKLLSQ